MFSWILLIASFTVLVLMFLRRLRLTRRDMIFQENLAEEQAMEQGEEILPDGPIEDDEKRGGITSVRKGFMEADTHFSRGKYEEAEPLFLAVIEADEGHLDAHHKLGLLYMKRGDFGQAELYFSKLIGLKKDPIYYSNLGAALYQQQRLVEAAEAYENAIAMDDKRAARLQSLAQVYYELEDDEKALKYFELAAKRKPKDINLKMILVEYYERLERREEAAAVLEKILELDPYNKEAKVALGALKGIS